MKHYIIVKYTDAVKDKAEMLCRIRALFSAAAFIPGVKGAKVIANCVDRDNRYDVMIVVDMEKSALETWDASEVHRTWKEQFGSYVAKKTIFDGEE